MDLGALLYFMVFSFIWNVDLLSVAGVVITLIALGVIVVIGMLIFRLIQEVYWSIINRNPKIEKFIDRTIGVIGLLAIVFLVGIIILKMFM